MGKAMADQQQQQKKKPSNSAVAGRGVKKAKTGTSSNRDPQRPRRKKARRACYACQRAHLTCGDERPCQRCIKRGLQGACQDGVRKKAKYIHEAINPGAPSTLGGHLGRIHSAQVASAVGMMPTVPVLPSSIPSVHTQDLYTTPQMTEMGPASLALSQITMPHVQPDTMIGGLGDSAGYLASPFVASVSGDMAYTCKPSTLSMPIQPAYGAAHNLGTDFYDLKQSSYALDVGSLNFEASIGNLDMDIFGQTPSALTDMNAAAFSLMTPGNQSFAGPVLSPAVYGDSPGGQTTLYGSDTFNLSNMTTPQGCDARMHYLGDQSSAPLSGQLCYSSASSLQFSTDGLSNVISSADDLDFSASPDGLCENSLGERKDSAIQDELILSNLTQSTEGISRAYSNARDFSITLVAKSAQTEISNSGKHELDLGVIEPPLKQTSSYANGYGHLIAYLKRRLPPQKALLITQALASMRPHFDSSSKTLNKDDLLFMDKCFQRTLWEYEEFINAYGTPTIVCRRAGEVAAVSKEFTMLTGWQKDVLLGLKSNENFNDGSIHGFNSSSARDPAHAATASAAESSSLLRPVEVQKSSPVLLAELLDDESIVRFYEDFSKLACGDARGSVMAPCKLLSYQTKARSMPIGRISGVSDASLGAACNGAPSSEDDTNIAAPTRRKVDCMYCWTVKRDILDAPMLVVMNFLPCL